MKGRRPIPGSLCYRMYVDCTIDVTPPLLIGFKLIHFENKYLALSFKSWKNRILYYRFTLGQIKNVHNPITSNKYFSNNPTDKYFSIKFSSVHSIFFKINKLHFVSSLVAFRSRKMHESHKYLGFGITWFYCFYLFACLSSS